MKYEDVCVRTKHTEVTKRYDLCLKHKSERERMKRYELCLKHKSETERKNNKRRKNHNSFIADETIII